MLARARKNSLGLPDDIDMVGATAHVEGLYRRLPDGTKSPFTIHSPSANAVRTDVIHGETAGPDVEPGVNGRSVRARAIVTRRVASLFKDVDFENDGKHKIPWQFLKNAADSTTIRVEFTYPLEGIAR